MSSETTPRVTGLRPARVHMQVVFGNVGVLLKQNRKRKTWCTARLPPLVRAYAATLQVHVCFTHMLPFNPVSVRVRSPSRDPRRRFNIDVPRLGRRYRHVVFCKFCVLWLRCGMWGGYLALTHTHTDSIFRIDCLMLHWPLACSVRGCVRPCVCVCVCLLRRLPSHSCKELDN